MEVYYDMAKTEVEQMHFLVGTSTRRLEFAIIYAFGLGHTVSRFCYDLIEN